MKKQGTRTFHSISTAGPYVVKLYDSWVHFTWRLARYYQQFLIQSERLSEVLGPYLWRIKSMHSALESNPHLFAACLTTLLLGPVLYFIFCSKTKSRNQRRWLYPLFEECCVVLLFSAKTKNFTKWALKGQQEWLTLLKNLPKSQKSIKDEEVRICSFPQERAFHPLAKLQTKVWKTLDVLKQYAWPIAGTIRRCNQHWIVLLCQAIVKIFKP